MATSAFLAGMCGEASSCSCSCYGRTDWHDGTPPDWQTLSSCTFSDGTHDLCCVTDGVPGADYYHTKVCCPLTTGCSPYAPPPSPQPPAPPPAPPSPPPPLSPLKAQVSFALVVAGAVDDYNDEEKQAEMEAAVAATAGVAPSRVSMMIEAASVKLTFTIAVEDKTAAGAVQTSMTTATASTGGATQMFADAGVTVDVEQIAEALAIAIFGDEAAGGGLSVGAIVGIIVGAVAVAALVVVLLWFFVCRKGKGSKTAAVAPPPVHGAVER